MTIPFLFVVFALLGTAAASPGVYNGRDSQLRVAIPRLEAVIAVDGVLNEPVWTAAATLTGFSQYAPADGRPADDSTSVLVWYSPTAIHFGIRAHAAPGAVRATLANRDRIEGDDHVQIFLSTFNDGRQALVFGVNPFGVQLDGALVEGTRAQGGGFGGLAGGRETPDLSPDFVFQSKGRLTDVGYEVELSIPFKSLRYPSASTQSWGIHVIRRVQQSGHEDSWSPARREGASFLAQSGTLEGLTDLRRGLVLDLNPVVTAKIDGSPSDEDWRYEAGAPEIGGNIRWGVTSNLTLNGTINPDFSQVESDAGQFQFDPRQALFFAEKRPFFLEGIEQFTTPNNLIYTRRIVSPIAAAKLTGKVAGTTVALLSAVDSEATSLSGHDHPVYNLGRVQRDIGGQSKAAFVYTDKVDGRSSNRVAGADARLVFGGVYNLQLQAAVSRTSREGVTTTAPLWQATLNRNGRRFGLRYALSGIDPEFRAASGFIPRGGIVHGVLTNQVTFYGRQGAAIEKWTGDVVVDRIWQYDDFVGGRVSQDRKLHVNGNFTFRGGWRAGGSVLIESFGYDDALYADYALERSGPSGVEIVPFTGVPRLPNLDFVATLNTPRRKGFAGNVFLLWGRDENFFEWAPADIVFANLGAEWRPTDKVRVDATYQLQSYDRRTDGSTVGIRRIPRLKMEYQLSPSIFLRLVGEYDAQRQADLRDDSRTNLPILIRNPSTGTYERALAFEQNVFRADWLFSYQPTPGTVIFAGYGSTLSEPQSLRFRQLRRLSDGFFMKVSYLFRM